MDTHLLPVQQYFLEALCWNTQRAFPGLPWTRIRPRLQGSWEGSGFGGDVAWDEVCDQAHSIWLASAFPELIAPRHARQAAPVPLPSSKLEHA